MRLSHSKPTRRGGFTFVELLIVISIIAVLLALLMPAIQRARRQAILSTCMAGQRQLIAAMLNYGNDHGDMLPRFDNYSGASNLSDLPWNFYNVMHGQYGVPQQCFFCPAADPELIETYWNYWGQSEICIGYSLWIPHICTGNLVPPISGEGLNVVAADSAMRGPTHMGASSAFANNPIISDPIYLYTNSVSGNPAQFNFGNAPQSLFWYDYGGHFWAGKFECATAGWVDGHVELHDGTNTHIYYESYNSWICR